MQAVGCSGFALLSFSQSLFLLWQRYLLLRNEKKLKEGFVKSNGGCHEKNNFCCSYPFRFYFFCLHRRNLHLHRQKWYYCYIKQTRLNLYEQKMLKAGFDGAYSGTHKVVMMFEPVDAEPVKYKEKPCRVYGKRRRVKTGRKNTKEEFLERTKKLGFPVLIQGQESLAQRREHRKPVQMQPLQE